MTHTISHRTVDELHPRARVRLAWIGFLQVIGAIFIIVSTVIRLPEQQHLWFPSAIVVVAIIPGTVLVLVHYFNKWDSLFSFWRKRIDSNPIEVEECIILSCFLLVVADLLLCGLLIAPSGGFLASIYSPLLLAVVATAAALRLHKTAIVATFIIAFFVAFGSEAYHRGGGIALIEVDDSKEHALALGTNLVATMLIPLAAAWIDARKSMPEQMIQQAKKALNSTFQEEEALVPACRKGLRTYLGDVIRGLDTITTGAVHSPETPAIQAFILMYPYQHMHKRTATIAYLTFTAHWFDDFFDGRYLKAMKSSDGPGIHFQNVQPANIYNISRHLRRVAKMTRARVPRSSQWIVDRSFLRIALGGLLQHARFNGDVDVILSRMEMLAATNHLGARRWYRRWQTVDKLRFRKPMDGRNGTGVDNRIVDLYKRIADHPDSDGGKLILWGTSKNVMELFDFVYPKIADLYLSELYSVFYTPLLVCQNLIEENKVETFSSAFRNRIFDPNKLQSGTENGSEELSRLLKPCWIVFEDAMEHVVAQPAEVLLGRRRQLRALVELYGLGLPTPLREEYNRILDNNEYWVPRDKKRQVQRLGK